MCSCTCLRFLVLDGNCWALRHGQAFLPVSRKQNLVHVHTEMLSCPGRAATSMSLSSISSRVKLTSLMAGDKNCNFTLWKSSRIGTFHTVVHDVSSFVTKNRHSVKMSARALTRSRHFRGRAQAERLDSRETIREKMVAIQKFPSYVFISRRLKAVAKQIRFSP